MKLDLNKIREITLGANRVEEEQDGFHFYRFTPRQEALYKERSDDFYKKVFATSGIQLSFKTSSENLFIKANVFSGSSRTYFSFDLFVNGEKVDTLNNFEDAELTGDYTTIPFPVGEVKKRFSLGKGEKSVALYFPWSAKTVLKEISLDDGASVLPIKPKHKLLCFGDSITQGYDAVYPSNKYVSLLAKRLDAEEHNKAIGGEIFFPGLAAEKENFEPDYITVAYGTNDWGRCIEQEFSENCKEFFVNLKANYPNAKIFVITPIWRKDYEQDRVFGKFEKVAKIIEDVAGGFENVTVIHGFSFVDHDEQFFADLRLHPNDKGFGQYFEALARQIKED